MEPISLGATGSAVADLQRRLTEAGVSAGGDEQGVFGEATLHAVRTFQQHRGLVADGVVGEDTWLLLVGASFTLGDRLLTDTRPMMRGDDVRELQRRLNRLGFDAGYDDGIYGPNTADAARDFQVNAGLPTDGITGPDTADALKALHREHQEAPAFAVRERESLRGDGRWTIAGSRLLIDPCRGPADPGRRGPGDVPEHEITWAIAKRLSGRLSALGSHTVLARGPHTTPSPSRRAAVANEIDVEAILSVRLNGVWSVTAAQKARGAAAYYFGQDRYVSERGRVLAQLALDNVVERCRTVDCRTHPSTSALLRESRAPAVIVEPGFLTHPDEGRALATPNYQSVIADALTDAVVTFMLGIEKDLTASSSAPAT